jgi:hypothetical protein
MTSKGSTTATARPGAEMIVPQYHTTSPASNLIRYPAPAAG